jgi:major type 1 subunit fimbrin (pilin)
MKVSKHVLYLAGVGALTFAAQAFASDGTITFTGTVSAGTCTIDVNGSASGTATVKLDPVTQTSLAAAGATAGSKPFTIALTKCSGATKVKTAFELGANVDTATGALKNTASDGSTAQIQVLNDAGAPINLGTNANSQQATIDSTANTATLQYYTRYYAKAASTTAGAVSTSVTYSMSYE